MHAVIKTGGKQYLVTEDDELQVELLENKTSITFDPLLVFDDESVEVGTPTVEGAKVEAKIVERVTKGEKIRVVRFKPKSRQHSETGHRQKYTTIQIKKITK